LQRSCTLRGMIGSLPVHTTRTTSSALAFRRRR